MPILKGSVCKGPMLKEAVFQGQIFQGQMFKGKIFKAILLVVVGWLLFGCGGISYEPISAVGGCQFETVNFDADFQTGRLSSCRQMGDDSYELIIEPESSPAHHSPWYAFRVRADQDKRITVKLRYTEKEHRYAPKISRDKRNWSILPASRVREMHDGRAVRMRLDVGPQPLFVAGQEIIDNQNYDQWESALAGKPFVTRSVIGKSERGRAITKLETNSAASGDYLVLVGRQHPPEVTGALAMIYFVNTVMADTPLAQRFRQRVNLLIVPDMNPDGVALGYWRKNTNGIDLNRDWGPFEQAETRVVGNELKRFSNQAGNGSQEKIRFFIDFHSTVRDIFYTLSDGLPGNPSAQIDGWLSGLKERMPDYEVRTRASYKPDHHISKNYIYKTYGVPAVTYELGDNTNRSLIRRQATVAAEEMMKWLLKQSALNESVLENQNSQWLLSKPRGSSE